MTIEKEFDVSRLIKERLSAAEASRDRVQLGTLVTQKATVGGRYFLAGIDVGDLAYTDPDVFHQAIGGLGAEPKMLGQPSLEKVFNLVKNHSLEGLTPAYQNTAYQTTRVDLPFRYIGGNGQEWELRLEIFQYGMNVPFYRADWSVSREMVGGV